MGFSRQQQRALLYIGLAIYAAIMLSWAGIALLIALSILWPYNHALQIVLAAWVLAVLAALTVPGRGKLTGSGRRHRIRMLVVAPVSPVLRLKDARRP